MPANTDFIAGAYSITSAAVDLGVTLNGFRLAWSADDEPITVDLYGSQPIDRIFRGISNMTLSFDVVQLTTAIRTAALRYFNAGVGQLEEAGTLLRAQTKAVSLILTALTGPAAAPKVGFQKYGFHAYPLGDIEQVFNSQQLQAFNLTFQIFPTLFNGTIPAGISGAPPSDEQKSTWFYTE